MRRKRTDGVWEPWSLLPGMVWEDGGTNENVTVVTYSDRDPVRREFTFDWIESQIQVQGKEFPKYPAWIIDFREGLWYNVIRWSIEGKIMIKSEEYLEIYESNGIFF